MPVVKRKRKVERMARRTTVESGISFAGWETMSPVVFNHKRQSAQQYYYQEWTGKALVDYVYTWMKKNGYSTQDINKAKEARGLRAIPENLGAWCKILDDGCPDINAQHVAYMSSMTGITGQVLPITDYIKETIAIAINGTEKVKPKEEVPAVKKIPDIQARVKSFLAEYCGDIDEWLDTWTTNPKKFDLEGFDVLKNLQAKDTSAFYASHIIAAYAANYADIKLVIELRKNPTGDDEDNQLLESYENHTTTSLGKLLKAYQLIVDACIVIKEKKKVQRKPRKAKPVNVQKLAEKINYMKSHDGLKIVSVDPLGIIGAQEVWVFNTKSRMLGHYFANDMQSLAIKGTTIQNFNEVKSIEKKLRKPEEQLKEFKSLGKVALKKFLESIRAKPGAMSGRLNKDVVILKVG